MTLTWPGKLKGDPNKRFKDKYCHFHRDHGHNMCYDLKQPIKAFIRQGKLQQFISKERANPPQEQVARRENEHSRPRMIVRGTTTLGSSKKARKTYLKMVQNVQLTGFIPKTTL